MIIWKIDSQWTLASLALWAGMVFDIYLAQNRRSIDWGTKIDRIEGFPVGYFVKSVHGSNSKTYQSKWSRYESKR